MNQKKKPTIKQLKAFDKIMENHGNVSSAMREVGYSEATAKNPKNLTRSQGFKELLDLVGLDDDSLSRKHQELLNCSDKQIELRALDMAYKLKGNYAPEKKEVNGGFSLTDILNNLDGTSGA
jgi:hypothetical protein